VGASIHNTLLRCNVSQVRQHVSALYYHLLPLPFHSSMAGLLFLKWHSLAM